jgi:ABC-type amino acid transport substrate-binding protein
MKRWRLLALLMVTALAQGETLRVGIEQHDYYPYYRATLESPPEGYCLDLLEAFAEYEGLTLELLPQPLNRLYRNMLDEQNLDLLFPDNPEWARQAKADRHLYYSEAAAQIVDGTMVLANRRGQGLNNIRHLGTVRGFTAQAWQPQLDAGTVHLVETQDLHSLIRMVVRGRLDALYANPQVVRYQLAQLDMSNNYLQLDPQLPLIYTSFHLSSASRPDLIERFDAFLAHQPDTLQRLKTRYGL